ncbi:MAG: MFS transporter [Flexilinea sp.]|nr:MFS transporter [Flexilinea sp.]
MAKEAKKVKGSLTFRDYAGTALMALTDCISASLMTSWFMTYLTDYSGIAGAAAIATTILLVMRLFDAVNDPIEAWIMDKAKVGKFGKYKPFLLISILFEFIGVVGLFTLPESVAANRPLAIIWLVIAYLIYDIGGSFFAPNLIYRTVTLDSGERGKLMIAPRMLNMITGMITGSFLAIVANINTSMNLGSLHRAFGRTVLIFEGAFLIFALIGVFLVKEKHHPKEDEDETAIIKVSDVIRLFKENEALRIRFLATLFSGFMWTFMFATMLYYLKYGYCVDPATGAFDTDKYGIYSLIGSMMMLLPLLIGTVIATPIMKKFETTVKAYDFGLLLEAIPLGVMFVLQILGILQSVPVVFFILLAIAATGIGYNYIPGEIINIECMDYELYKNGKDRSAMVNATAKFLDKMQNAFSSGIVGLILIAIGYKVDAATGDYIGELSTIPTMNNWFIVVMGLIPFILGIIAILIYRKYPITKEIAADMKAKLTKSQLENN